MARTWKALVVAAWLSACPVWAGDGNGKVKVFILAGQSNMEGLGHTRTLAHLGDDPQYGGLLKKIRNDDGSWVTREDVFVSFRGGKTTGPLSVGFGADKEFVGPELMFGVIMGDAFKDPVLLIKTAWGGKDLHFDFRPPGAGKLPYPIDPEALTRRAREYAGLLDNRSFGGAQVSRTFYARGQTGQQLLLGAYSALMRQVGDGKAKLYTRHEMLDVVVVDGIARGIVCRDLQSGEIKSFAGDAVLLCTGGYGNVFYLSSR